MMYKTKNSLTKLQIAVRKGNVEMVEQLLSEGHNIREITKDDIDFINYSHFVEGISVDLYDYTSDQFIRNVPEQVCKELEKLFRTYKHPHYFSNYDQLLENHKNIKLPSISEVSSALGVSENDIVSIKKDSSSFSSEIQFRSDFTYAELKKIENIFTSCNVEYTRFQRTFYFQDKVINQFLNFINNKPKNSFSEKQGHPIAAEEKIKYKILEKEKISAALNLSENDILSATQTLDSGIIEIVLDPNSNLDLKKIARDIEEKSNIFMFYCDNELSIPQHYADEFFKLIETATFLVSPSPTLK